MDDRMRRTQRAPAAICTLAMVLSAFHMHAASASTARSLARDTLVKGSQGSTSVFLPKTVTLSAAIQKNPDIKISGRGLAGFALIPDKIEETSLLALRVGPDVFCPDGDCPRDGVLTFVRGTGVDLQKETATLDAGSYTLYVIGEEVTARVRLTELEGRTRILPSESAPMTITPVEPDVATPGFRSTFTWYGAPRDLGRAGETFSVIWWRTLVHGRTETDYCLYDNDERETEPHTFLCPFAPVYHHYTHGIASVSSAWNAVDWNVIGVRGPVGQAWSYASAGVVEQVSGFALWLPYT